jgi:hypothetical protein
VKSRRPVGLPSDSREASPGRCHLSAPSFDGAKNDQVIGVVVTQPFDLWGQRGWAGTDVVGESHYFSHIRSLFPTNLKGDGMELELAAQLIPEPKNIHDPTAVAVRCGGGCVGYLAREQAAAYFPILSALVAEDWSPQVKARVWGANRDEYDYDVRGKLVERQSFVGSVRLDLAEPHLLVPVNMPPEKPYILLPTGNAIQVTGEEIHIRTLIPFLRDEGEAWIYATLHELVEQMARSSRTIVEVRIDTSPVGKLTPRMSAELLPAIRHLAEHGSCTAVRAIVKGNRIKADVVLYTARANQLSAAWLEDLTPSKVGRAGQPSSTAASNAQPAAGSRAIQRQPEPLADSRPVAASAWKFNPAPGWPPPPSGWEPPPDWRPDPSWPPAPPGWSFWSLSAQRPGSCGIESVPDRADP